MTQASNAMDTALFPFMRSLVYLSALLIGRTRAERETLGHRKAVESVIEEHYADQISEH